MLWFNVVLKVSLRFWTIFFDCQNLSDVLIRWFYVENRGLNVSYTLKTCIVSFVLYNLCFSKSNYFHNTLRKTESSKTWTECVCVVCGVVSNVWSAFEHIFVFSTLLASCSTSVHDASLSSSSCSNPTLKIIFFSLPFNHNQFEELNHVCFYINDF